MPTYGSTDLVRKKATVEYIEPARRTGASHVQIHSGTFNKTLVENQIVPANRLPLVCNALTSKKFQRENYISLESAEGPPSGHSSTMVFTYRLEPMPWNAAPNSPSQSVFLGVRGALKNTYKKLGGGEKFHQSQREAWNR